MVWEFPDGEGGVIEVRKQDRKPPQYHEAKAAGTLEEYLVGG